MNPYRPQELLSILRLGAGPGSVMFSQDAVGARRRSLVQQRAELWIDSALASIGD